MSTEIERRVGNLLNNSQGSSSVNNSGVAPDQGGKQVPPNVKVANPVSVEYTDANKEKLNFELKERQEKLMVYVQFWHSLLLIFSYHLHAI